MEVEEFLEDVDDGDNPFNSMVKEKENSGMSGRRKGEVEGRDGKKGTAKFGDK